MKPKIELDPMFASDLSRRPRPVLRPPFALAAIATIALWAMSLHAGQALRRTPPRVRTPMRAPRAWTPAPRAIPGPVPVSPRPAGVEDHFVVTAPAELDAAMVAQAREDIDPGMVVRPRGWAGAVPSMAPRLWPPIPGAAPGFFPGPGPYPAPGPYWAPGPYPALGPYGLPGPFLLPGPYPPPAPIVPPGPR